jgi:hypothetical protein
MYLQLPKFRRLREHPFVHYTNVDFETGWSPCVAQFLYETIIVVASRRSEDSLNFKTHAAGDNIICGKQFGTVHLAVGVFCARRPWNGLLHSTNSPILHYGVFATSAFLSQRAVRNDVMLQAFSVLQFWHNIMSAPQRYMRNCPREVKFGIIYPFTKNGYIIQEETNIGRETCVTLILNMLHTTPGNGRKRTSRYLREIKNIIVINVFVIVNNAQKLTHLSNYSMQIFL